MMRRTALLAALLVLFAAHSARADRAGKWAKPRATGKFSGITSTSVGKEPAVRLSNTIWKVRRSGDKLQLSSQGQLIDGRAHFVEKPDGSYKGITVVQEGRIIEQRVTPLGTLLVVNFDGRRNARRAERLRKRFVGAKDGGRPDAIGRFLFRPEGGLDVTLSAGVAGKDSKTTFFSR